MLSMMQTYTQLYNAGSYASATSYVSSDIVRDCRGAARLAKAMSTNHNIEEIDYTVASVKAWGPDDPNMADVASIEHYGGDSYRYVLGLKFALEGGSWKLNDLYPLGIGAFC